MEQLSPSKGHAKLEHSDFMKKVPEVLGKDHGNFSGIYQDSYCRDQKGYKFPKREACLMAMSYSYELQAQVFDYMTELENKTAFKIPQTMSEALILAGQQMQLAEERQVQLELAKPKVEFVDCTEGFEKGGCMVFVRKQHRRKQIGTRLLEQLMCYDVKPSRYFDGIKGSDKFFKKVLHKEAQQL